MKDVCPYCTERADLEEMKRLETFDVRGEKIKVEVDVLKCLSCGEVFDNPRAERDPYAVAYREYRKMHGLLMPEEIRAFREKHRLSQKEFSGLLGIGIATLNRYENGSLQSEANENLMRSIIDDASSFARRLRENLDAVPDGKKRGKIIQELEASEGNKLEKDFKTIVEMYEPNELTGYKKLEMNKVYNSILFFCNGGIFKTALNKHLFYSDFKHFKEYKASITGLRYKHLPYGPTPEHYNQYYSLMEEGSLIEINEVVVGNFLAEEYKSLTKPDLAVFSESELKILLEIKERFRSFTSTGLKDLSHEEDAYKKTNNMGFIPYTYADTLKV